MQLRMHSTGACSWGQQAIEACVVDWYDTSSRLNIVTAQLVLHCLPFHTIASMALHCVAAIAVAW
jgi:hypothetical protein